MIRTTRLRSLRTSPRLHLIIHSHRTLRVLSAPRRHVPPCVLRLYPHASCAAFTTSSLRPARHAASSPAAQVTHTEPASTVETCPPRPAAANPPATTRPPPLDLPTRDPHKSAFSFYVATGKAYLKFYKTGLKHIYLNTRLVWALDTKTAHPEAPGPTIDPASRAAFLLRRRWRHDVRRLPPFALLLLVCGEFTPLVVLAFPRLVPYPCRIPRQRAALQRATEARRRAAEAERARAAAVDPRRRPQQAAVHLARALSLLSPLWDRLGVPDRAVAWLAARRKVRAHLRFLLRDDFLLRQAGGVAALEGEEVVLACLDRAMDTQGHDQEALRCQLLRWLETAPSITSEISSRAWSPECEYLFHNLINGLNLGSDGKPRSGGVFATHAIQQVNFWIMGP